MSRTLKDYAAIAAKGVAMGAADVVPGVSGGTIAFISGIYEEFINALRSFGFPLIKKLKEEGVSAAWKYINGNFLLSLFSGILCSVALLAKFITYLLKTYPEAVWSFFFGLIVASAWFVGIKIKQKNISTFLFLLIGAGIAYYITIASPTQTPEAYWFILLSGAIAICAMILPGISGSFILLLLGKYAFIMESISTLNIKVIATFALGCIVGLLSFSHLLSWMFRKYYDFTIALLTGFMLGSLNKVWPWKNTLTWITNRHGMDIPLTQTSVLPQHYTGDAHLFVSIALACCGFLLIVVLEKIASPKAA